MKTALILPGGGTKGAFEAGACKEIFKRLTPDLIVGTSVGALNGVILANGKDPMANVLKLERIWRGAKRSTFFPYNRKLFYKYHLSRSIFNHAGLYNQLRKNVSVDEFEKLDIPLHVNCTDMNTGDSRIFGKGPLFDPIVASCSLPPFFPPVDIGGVPYIDGSVSSYFGIKGTGCEQIIIVSLFKTKYECRKGTLAEYTDRTSAILIEQLIKNEMELSKDFAKVINITHDFRSVHISDFSCTDELIRLGEKAAKNVMG